MIKIKYFHLKVDFMTSEEFIPESLFGQVDYHFNNHIEAIKDKDCLIVDLGFSPRSFHTLPNGNLVIAGKEPFHTLPNGDVTFFDHGFLKIYDKKFKLLKTIDKINHRTFNPQYLTSTGKDSIYLTDLKNNQIIQTDFDFNFIKQFGSKGSSNQQLNLPLGITFNEDSIYICDYGNERIQKLSQNLNYQETYPLKSNPRDIKIIKNCACIMSNVMIHGGIKLYYLNPFLFKGEISCNKYSDFSHNEICWVVAKPGTEWNGMKNTLKEYKKTGME